MSSINDLPNELLEKIFILATPWLDESIAIAQVCQRWRHLMKQRFALVKYLVQKREPTVKGRIHSSGKFLLDHRDIKVEDLHKMCMDQLPNLMVYVDESQEISNGKIFSEMINNKPSIQCAAFRWLYDDTSIEPMEPLRNIEMLAFDGYTSLESKMILCHERITQLYFGEAENNSLNALANCPRLRRLHMFRGRGTNPGPLSKFRESALANLEMIEMSVSDNVSLVDLLYNIEYCPKLESIFIHLYLSCDPFYADDCQHHLGVKNLVLETDIYMEHLNADWTSHKKILKQFPNLKNLALRYTRINDEEGLYGILKMLSKLEYLEINESDIPTHHPSQRFATKLDPGKIISKYFALHGRMIECKVITVVKDKRRVYAEVGEGFDFMENVFSRDFHFIPYFLIT